MARLGWWIFSRYSDWSIRRNARTDAVQEPPLPLWDSDQHPAYVMELKQVGDSSVRALARRWSERDQTLRPAVETARSVCKRAEENVEDARARCEKACADYEEARGHPPQEGLSGKFVVYWAIIGFLFLVEFPMNQVVFRLFGENELFTIVATLFVAGSLLICAHSLSKRIVSKERTDRYWVAVLIGLPILTMFAVAYFRQQYLAHIGGLAEQLSPYGTFFAFFVMNVLVYLAAVVAGVLLHDEELMAVQKARKQLLRAQRHRDAAESAFNRARAAREKMFEGIAHQAREIKDAVQRAIEIYWGENMRIRNDRGKAHASEYPKAYYNYPEVTIPPEIETLGKEAEQ